MVDIAVSWQLHAVKKAAKIGSIYTEKKRTRNRGHFQLGS